jgi:hypothetical protein
MRYARGSLPIDAGDMSWPSNAASITWRFAASGAPLSIAETCSPLQAKTVASLAAAIALLPHRLTLFGRSSSSNYNPTAATVVKNEKLHLAIGLSPERVVPWSRFWRGEVRA